ncbi:MAG: hypothetical protein CL763_10050 [Chloroflexi bacterium]|nr:hypothetical protein [Chloroflexota bacterium]
MNFDENGQRIRRDVTLKPVVQGLTPQNYELLKESGIDGVSIQVLGDMTATEDTGKVFEILLKMTRLQQ